MTTINLDQIAAESSQAMIREALMEEKKSVEILERVATKALGVLQEQGVYALLIFLFSRTSDEKDIASLIRKQLYQVLVKLPPFENQEELPEQLQGDDVIKVLEYYSSEILEDLDILLLIRDLYEQILIYARYGAKAAGG